VLTVLYYKSVSCSDIQSAKQSRHAEKRWRCIDEGSAHPNPMH